MPTKRATVLCTLPMDPAGQAMLAPVADIVSLPEPGAAALYRAITGADILLVRTQLPPDIFTHPHHLIGVVRNGTGLDFIPVAAASQQGIPVANVPGANAQAVVEYCIASFLLLSRPLHAMNSDLRTAGWGAARAHASAGAEMAGKTVGIVGLGAVGSALARVCKDGFGMRVLGCQPNAAGIPAFVQPVDLTTLFAESDYVSLNCPLTDATRHLVDAAMLRRMKPDAVIVNAARGAVIEEQALATALREKWIKGAAIDVYAEQPMAPDHPFLGLHNIVLTPHVAALTRESNEKMSVGAARQILQLLQGQRPDHLVNPEVWEGYQARRASMEAFL